MAGLLDTFLARERAEPFGWARKNCGLWVADWIALVTGIDPAWPCRLEGATTADEWRAYVDRHGGFAAMVATLMSEAGFAPTEAPRRGDVGVIRGPNGEALAAIRGNRVWIARTARGLHFENLPTLAAWQIVPCLR